MHIIRSCRGTELFDHRCRDRYHQTSQKIVFSLLLVVVTIGAVFALVKALKTISHNRNLQVFIVTANMSGDCDQLYLLLVLDSLIVVGIIVATMALLVPFE